MAYYLLLGMTAIISIILISILKDKESSIILMLMLISLSGALLFFLFYMVKDFYYYGIIRQLFFLNTKSINFITFLPISNNWLIRFINFFTLAFIYSCIYFVLSFTKSQGNINKKYLIYSAIPLILELIIYDPLVQKLTYYILYPAIMTSRTYYVNFQPVIHKITIIINISYLIIGTIILIKAFFKSSKIHFIRNKIFLVFVMYIFLVSFYLFLLNNLPSFLLQVSKIADYVSYKPISISSNYTLFRIAPYILLMFFILLTFSIYLYTIFLKRMNSNDSIIIKKIEDSSLPARIFAHYLKNEILELMSDMEFLLDGKKTLNVRKSNLKLNEIYSKCKRIYAHMDKMSGRFKNINFNMQLILLNKVIFEILNDTSYHNLCKIHTNLTPYEPICLADSYYIKKVLENIIINAIESFPKYVNKTEKKVIIQTHVEGQWIIIAISDNGKGIHKDNIDKIFDPYYSTKSTSNNWGMGLSICFKIIKAHDGKIIVESDYGKGSSFKILLPLANKKLKT